MAEPKKQKPAAEKKPKTRIGQNAGKDPAKTNEVMLTGSKYTSGGAKNRKRAGGIIRKPKATIRYKRKES